MLRHCSCRTSVLSVFIQAVADVQIRAVSTATHSVRSRAPRNKTAPPKWEPPVRPGDAQRDPNKSKAFPFGRRAAPPPKSKEKKSASTGVSRLASRQPLRDDNRTTRARPRASKPMQETQEDAGDTVARPLPSARRLRRATTAKPSADDGNPARDPHGDEDDIIAALLQDAERPKEAKKEQWWKDGHSPNLPAWAVRKNKMREAGMLSGEGWNPRKKVSPDSLNGIRALHASDPETYSARVLAQHFGLDYESIYRILHSKWQPSDDEREDMRKRWETRTNKKKQVFERQRFRKNSARIINSILHPAYEPGMRRRRREQEGEGSANTHKDGANAFLRRRQSTT